MLASAQAAALSYTLLDGLQERQEQASSTFVQVRLEHLGATADVSNEVKQRGLRVSVDALEQAVGVFAIAEALVELGPQTFADLPDKLNDLGARLHARTPFDVLEVLSRQFAERAPPTPPPEIQEKLHAIPVREALKQVIPMVDAMVASCPIAELEADAIALGLETVGHRCRRSWEWLRALVRRHEVGFDARVRVAGAAFADGRLSIGEAAMMLGMSRMDVAAWLEELGFHRTPEKITLTDAQRAAALAKLRQEREARGGSPPGMDQEQVERDVVASMRIEGVDARPGRPLRS